MSLRFDVNLRTENTQQQQRRKNWRKKNRTTITTKSEQHTHSLLKYWKYFLFAKFLSFYMSFVLCFVSVALLTMFLFHSIAFHSISFHFVLPVLCFHFFDYFFFIMILFCFRYFIYICMCICWDIFDMCVCCTLYIWHGIYHSFARGYIPTKVMVADFILVLLHTHRV